MSELISVIVPVYKVEQYLDKCVESILAQTYKNLEIILVDDGSPDRCGEMCEDWAKKDPRIKVVHKENGGLSDARNAGLDVATGDYIGFVDSDDWIDPEMYGTMYKAMGEYGADLAICCVEKVRKDGIFRQELGGTLVYSKQKVLYELICDEKVNSFAWNKLYRRELFQDLRYPKGRTFEDTLFTYKIFERVTRVVHVDHAFYHYLRREDSILGTWPVAVEIEFCLTQQERYLVLGETHPELKPAMMEAYMKQFWMMRGNFLKPDCENADQCGRKIKGEMAPFLWEKDRRRQGLAELSWVKKMSTFCFLHAPMLYRKIYQLLKGR